MQKSIEYSYNKTCYDISRKFGLTIGNLERAINELTYRLEYPSCQGNLPFYIPFIMIIPA